MPFMHSLYHNLEQMNTEQRAATIHGGGPMLVIAGPGSGKTFVITNRILYLIMEHKILSKTILVITFTKDAANSMLQRYHKMYKEIGNENEKIFSQVSIGTFHSIFFQILKSHQRYSKFTLINENKKQNCIEKVMSLFINRKIETDVKLQILSSISYYKNTLDLEKAKVMIGNEFESNFKSIFQKYEKMLEEYFHIDFDDMMYKSYMLLKEDGDFLKSWQNIFTYIMVDEFQDCNLIQYELLKLLASNQKNIFVVGDDDQAIYSFRGADPRIIFKFKEDNLEYKEVCLSTNYRCLPKIVDISKKVIDHNVLRVKKELIAFQKDRNKEAVKIIKYVNMKECYLYIVEDLKNNSEEELEEKAILVRTNISLRMLVFELVKNKIPFQIKENVKSIYDHFIIKDIIDFFEAAYGNRSREVFLRILNKPRLNVGRESLKEEISFSYIKEFYKKPPFLNSKAVADIERFEKQLDRLRRLPLNFAITFILKSIGYEKYLIKKSMGINEIMEEWNEILEWLKGEVEGFKDYSQWISYRSIERKEEKESISCRNSPKKGVHLLTLHGSKGLEFEHVYILNVNEGNIPKIRSKNEENQELLEEERRLFYVGLTRAKKTLEILYLCGTKEHPKFPSRFVEEINSNY